MSTRTGRFSSCPTVHPFTLPTTEATSRHLGSILVTVSTQLSEMPSRIHATVPHLQTRFRHTSHNTPSDHTHLENAYMQRTDHYATSSPQPHSFYSTRFCLRIRDTRFSYTLRLGVGPIERSHDSSMLHNACPCVRMDRGFGSRMLTGYWEIEGFEGMVRAGRCWAGMHI